MHIIVNGTGNFEMMAPSDKVALYKRGFLIVMMTPLHFPIGRMSMNIVRSKFLKMSIIGLKAYLRR